MKSLEGVACAIFLLLILVKSTVADAENGTVQEYTGYKVVEIIPQTQNELDLLMKIFPVEGNHDNYNFWRQPTQPGKPCQLQVNGDYFVESFDVTMKSIGMSYRIVVDDVQGLIEEQKPDNQVGRRSISSASGDVVGKFARVDDIYKWLAKMCKQFPKITSCGQLDWQTHENREIDYIKIGLPGTSKKGIFIESGMHAREWLAPASMIYIIDKLLKGYGKDRTISQLLTKFDWYLVPVANPDGYEYTQTTDRMWRKNRSPAPAGKRTCPGVDLNRNFDFVWNSIGSSDDSCSDIYAGEYAFSEPETMAVADFASQERLNLLGYFSIHSYGRYWLVPYGAGDTIPDDYSEMLRVAKIGTRALVNNGRQTWTVGNTIEVLYPSAGGSEDWAKSVVGPKYAYCLEVRPGTSTNGFETGFLARPEDIKPSGEEIWAGLSAAVAAMKLQ